jgi:putative phosphoesterase
MRLLIVSDLHANGPALQAVDETVDAAVFLGDAVDYGADAAEAVSWLQRHATYAVRGNHDHAVATGKPTGASPAMRAAAEACASWTRAVLGTPQQAFLLGLPQEATFEFAGCRFTAVHAAPSDALYRYLPPETSEQAWRDELRHVRADWLLYGHTHRPFLRRIGRVTILNPGSVGQPRDGVPFVSYAIWDDGDVSFVRRHYPVEAACRRLAKVSLDPEERAQLRCVLRRGA